MPSRIPIPRSPAPPARALAREIQFDAPVELLAAFADEPHAALLESVTRDEQGRWSFVAAEPFQVLTSRDGRVEIDGRPVAGDPFEVLRAELARFPLETDPSLPPFQGGAVGYLGYELGRHLERIPVPERDPLALPDMWMLFCDTVIAVDHRDRRAWIVSSGHPKHDLGARRARAQLRIAQVAIRIATSAFAPEPAASAPAARPRIRSNFSRVHYESAVRRVIESILAGDILQANLSQRFSAELPRGLGPLDLYRRLRAVNPAPFAALLRLGDAAVVSSSPERFMRLDAGRVETRPIKGTRRRGATPTEDEQLAAALLASEKDRAENTMIVDLLRNDLSRVCGDGSVQVPRLCALERFATVMHLVSTVTGVLREGLGPVDLLAATFPGGSITGAPKIRAMELIAELEGVRRGPYCGSAAWIGFDGSMDSSILIRTFAVRGRRLAFNAGGGVVADSTPAAEYEETLAKARALADALSPDGA